jgi:hypothetical protein
MIRQITFILLLLTFYPSQAKESTAASRATTIATEVVIFESKDEASPQALLQAAAAMVETIKSWGGFINRELIGLGNGKWIYIVHWADMASAQDAQEKAMQSEICLTFFSLIKEENMQMFHGDQVLMQMQEVY